MPSTGETAERGFDIDQGTHTIRFERQVAASRARVFDAWTTPAEVTRWWDPTGEPLAACEIDLRTGGSFAFTTRDHPDMAFTGTYREIARPDRLVFDAMGATGQVLLTEEGGATRMVVEIRCASAQHLAQFVKVGVHQGTSRTLDNLVNYARAAGDSGR